MGCRYYLGDWDAAAEQFVPESHGRMNCRRSGQSLTGPCYRDFFAPESVLTTDGRRVMWAWLTTLHPEINQKTVQSLPRELSLGEDGGLRIHPLRELESLRYDAVTLNDIVVNASGEDSPPIAELDGDSFEIRISIERREAERKRLGFHLFAGEESEGLPVLIRPESGTICVGEVEAPFAVSDLPALCRVCLQLGANLLRWRLLDQLDVVEVDGGAADRPHEREIPSGQRQVLVLVVAELEAVEVELEVLPALGLGM